MSGKSGLSWQATAYIGATLTLGAAVLFWALSTLPAQPLTGEQWLLLAVLTSCAATAQLFPVVTPKHQAYYLTLVFIVAGVLLLPPGALALLIVLTFIPEWIKIKYRWHIQLFNIANFALDAYLAKAIYIHLDGSSTVSLQHSSDVLAAIAAVCAFTFLNHLLLAIVLYFARKHSIRESGLFQSENFLTDATLATMGIIAVQLWVSNHWLVSIMAAPLFLIYRSLNTPNLEEQARTDGKTGLYNARHFYDMLQEELRRAGRFQRPLAVIMADMDLLRNINNTYGHLAGDIVLKGVADIIRGGLREYDIAARFGGEEYAILLPETDGEQALAVAERLRRMVESAEFSVTTCAKPIRATLSLGVACYPANGQAANEVIHQADLAVYYAKLRGRNRAWACSPESMALGAQVAGRGDLEALLEGVEQPPSNTATHRPVEIACVETASQDKVDRSDQGPMGPGATSASGRGERVEHGSRETEQPKPATQNTNQQQRTRRRGRASDLRWQVAILVAAVVGTAAIIYFNLRPWEARLDWYGVACLAVLAVAAQGIAIDIYGRGKISTSAILVLASGFLFGMPGVLLLAPVVAIATRVLRGGVLYRMAFDAGNTALAGSLAAVAHDRLSPMLPGEGLIWQLIPAIAAALCYYTVNVSLLSLAMGLSENRGAVAVWKERFRWLLPHYLVYGGLALVIAFGYQAIGIYGIISFFVPPVMLSFVMKQYIDRTEESVVEAKRVNMEMVQAHREVTRTLHELRETYGATLRALSAALDSRDSETEGHSRRVVEYAAAIARQLGLTEHELPGLRNGALVHDIGKIGVPDAILRKPGPLTEEEWAIMKTHPLQGYHILEQIGFLSDALPVVRHHHERYDGSGYPDGLRGEAIPLAARIFAVADTFDAMTSTRPYRQACSHETARAEIARCTGTQFDPRVVAAFLKVEAQELVKLSDNREVPNTSPEEEKPAVGASRLPFAIPAA